MAEQRSAGAPRWLTEREMAGWRPYIDGTQRLLEVLNRELVAHGVTIDDYRILVMLSESEDGSLRMGQLADGVVASRSRISHQVQRLQKLGYVTRREDASDRRGVVAEISPVGRAKLDALAVVHVGGVREHFIDLIGPEDLDALDRVFSAVDERLRKL